MYWFRPGWYGDIEVWTGADPEWGKAEVSGLLISVQIHVPFNRVTNCYD